MVSSSDPNQTFIKRSKSYACLDPILNGPSKSTPLQEADAVGESDIDSSCGIDPTSENSPKDRNGSGSHDQSSSLSRGSTEEVPDMVLDKTINKDDPAADHTSSSSRSSETSESKPSFTVVATSHKVTSKSDYAQGQDHPISSSVEASNSNAEPPKIPGQSISTSQVDQSKSNNSLITEDLGIQDRQSGLGRRPDTPIPESLRDEGYPSAQDEGEEPVDEEPYSSYVHEENYGKEEDYDQEQDHGHDPTASAHSSPDSIVTMIANDRLFAIDFTVYHTD
ncbi:hypothetical protein FOVSG1_000699 [Fusarium oxysporum f. sp. vasinfectum]